MTERSRFILVNESVRRNCLEAVRCADIGSAVSIGPATRSVSANAKFHAICSDIAKSGMEWAGKQRSLEEWKVLIVSAHTKATDGDVDFLIGIEGEFVNVRESTSRMSVARAASLITYSIAFCDTNGIHLTETIRSGFYDDNLSVPDSAERSTVRGTDEAADCSTSLPVAASSPLSDLEWLKTVARMLYAVANEGGDIGVLRNQATAANTEVERPDEIIQKAKKIYRLCFKVITRKITRKDALSFIVNIAGCKQSEVEGLE